MPLALALALAPVPAVAAQTVVQLFFGLSSPDGSGVSQQEWSAFVDQEIAPHFSGFTVMDCQGGWFDGAAVIREGCKHVLVFTDRDNDPKVSRAIAVYKQRFHQETVLRLERPCPESACRFE